MGNKFNRITYLLNKRLKLISGISFGVFLFILFFQPFDLERFEFNNRLLIIAGFGGITFILMLILSVVIQGLLKTKIENDNKLPFIFYLNGWLLLALSALAFTFYLRYVGSVAITFYVVFKIILICLLPPAVLMIYEKLEALVNQNELLLSERKMISDRIQKYEDESLNKPITFVSEAGAESFTVFTSELVFAQSADNYVEIACSEGENVRKRLIRNTLRNVEFQLRQYPNFIRCHRRFIINIDFAEKLYQDFGSHWVMIRGYSEKIPVSRQYLLKLREII